MDLRHFLGLIFDIFQILGLFETIPNGFENLLYLFDTLAPIFNTLHNVCESETLPYIYETFSGLLDMLPNSFESLN